MSADPVPIENREPSSAAERTSGPRAWMLALILAATLAALWPALRGGLVWDDLDTVARNPAITSFANLPKLFTSAMWDFSNADANLRIGYWRPLAGVGLLIGHEMGHGDPLWFHVISLTLHLLATAVALRLAWRLSRSVPVAFFASLMFGVHPVHVESVAWISAINDPLFGLFALLSIDAFLAWRDRGSVGWAWKSALFFLLALMSKELAAAALPVIVVIDWVRRQASIQRAGSISAPDRGNLLPLARAYGPFGVVIFLYYLARVAVFGSFLAGLDHTTIDYGVRAGRLALLRVELLGGFIGLLAWPFKLNLFREFQPALALSDPIILRAIACIAALAAIIWIAYRRRTITAVCAGLFIPAALLPVLVRVESLGKFPLSDRYLYLAVMGFTLLVAVIALRTLPMRVACFVLALLSLGYGVRSFNRTAFWHDEETLFSIAVADNPRSPSVHLGLGRVMLQKYRREHVGDTLRRAHAAYEKTLDLIEAAQHGDESIYATVEDHVQANLGYAWSLLYEAEVDDYHDFETASKVFKQVAERYPLSADAWTSLGVAHSQMNEIADAEKAFKKALELDPLGAGAYRGLALLDLRRGNRAEASANFQKALDLRPDSLEDAMLLAGALGDSGETAHAIEVAERARVLHPREAEPLAMLGLLAAQKGDLAAAAKYAQEAIELEPDNGKALLLKGKLQITREEYAGALRSLQRAADLLPLSFEAHYIVAALFLKNGSFESALPYLLRAYDCRPTGAVGSNEKKASNGDDLRDTLVKMGIQDVGTLSKLAAIDLQHGRDADASDWIERALALKPDHGPTLFLKGSLAKKRGDLEAAAAEWRKACEAMPDSASVNESLGMLLVEMKRTDEALVHLEKALEIATRASAHDEEQRSAVAMLRDAIDHLKKTKP